LRALREKYKIFDQRPGHAFHTITPAHLMALLNGSTEGLKVFDAGSGNGYWSILMASQGNTVVALDTYCTNTLFSLRELKSQNFTQVIDSVDVYAGDFVASLKRQHQEGEQFDMIISFNSLTFLTPDRVNQFFKISHDALYDAHEGVRLAGQLIGIAASPYEYSDSDPKMLSFKDTKISIKEMIVLYRRK